MPEKTESRQGYWQYQKTNAEEDALMDLVNRKLQSKRRLHWQCRRGMLELELFLTDFLEHDYESLSMEKKFAFEDLLTTIDPVLFDYLMGTDEPDDHGLRDIVHTIREATRQRVNA